MSYYITFTGGTEEIGASSVYLYLDGTGIIIDAGLHPKYRDKRAFPLYDVIKDSPADLLLLTHAHTDHAGGIPYLLKYHPQLKIFSTLPTRDLLELVLKDTAKLLKGEITGAFPEEALAYYKREALDKIKLIAEGFKYGRTIDFCGNAGRQDVKITFYPSGHILGSAGVYIEAGGRSFLQTGDVNFSDQMLLPAAELPRHHIDCLVIESTNAGNPNLPDYQNEKKRLASFINKVVNENGSVLMPVFALGKTQEMLKLVYELMRGGSIPYLPVYTAGLGKKISKVYDRYNYTVPRIEEGLKLSDIPQERIEYDNLFTGKYFKEPSLVLVSSGMVNKGTLAYNLAERWMMYKNFGIAIVGYQDEDTPGYRLVKSEKGKQFIFGGKKAKRACMLDVFRFTSHASLGGLLGYISDVHPKRLFIVHGDANAAGNLALNVSRLFADIKISIPGTGKKYDLF